MPTRGKRRGSALLAVLWLSAALTAIAFSVSAIVRAEIDRVSSSSDGLRASYLASGAVERAIQWMCWGPAFHKPDGKPFYEWRMPRLFMSFPSGDAVIELIPESAKMNINQAGPGDIERVVAAISGDPVQAQQVAAAILDWRGGGFPGPFDSFYQALNPTFRARHASIQEIEELMDVQGVTPELFYGNYIPDAQGRLYASGGLRDCFSVWGSAGPYDANTASPALMLALGVPQPGVAAIVAARQIVPFRNMGEVASLGFSAPRLGIGGNVIWTVRGVARLRRPDGLPSEVVRSASAVVKILDPMYYPGNPVQVLRWYEDSWSESELAPPAVPPLPTGAQP
jgi:general secretion pathway protein K